MTVDKFGHYYNQKYNSEALKKNDSKTLEIALDEDNNVDIQNKRIRNVAPPREGTDGINQTYLYAQINQLQEVLRLDFTKEFLTLRAEISELKKNLKDNLTDLPTLLSSSTIVYDNNSKRK